MQERAAEEFRYMFEQGGFGPQAMAELAELQADPSFDPRAMLDALYAAREAGPEDDGVDRYEEDGYPRDDERDGEYAEGNYEGSEAYSINGGRNPGHGLLGSPQVKY
jgi:hypothetical protein